MDLSHSVHIRVLRKMQNKRSALLGLRWAFALEAVWGRTPWFLLLPGKLGEEGALGRWLVAWEILKALFDCPAWLRG